MEEKLYETCAKNVKILMNGVQLKNDLNKILQTMQGVQVNQRLTDFGKEEALTDLREEFAERCKKQSEKIRAEIRIFCAKYAAEIPDDGENHSVEVGNILQVINTMGFDLTVETLKTIIEPIKDSGRLLKMVYDILKTKNINTPAEVGSFDPDIFTLLNEYLGINNEMLSYVDEYEKVRELLDVDVLVQWQVFDDYEYGTSGTILRMRDATPYSVLCLADNMMNVGKMYDQINSNNPRFFK